MKTKIYRRRFLFSIVPLLSLMFFSECVARIFGEPTVTKDQHYILPSHPTRLWGLSPYSTMDSNGQRIEINSFGLRKVPNTDAPLRILTLGDSNIFGHDLSHEDSLHGQLVQSLKMQNIHADVFCGGVPGYSSEQSRVLMNEWGWDKAPHLIVIANLLSDSTEEYFDDQKWIAQAHNPSRRTSWVFSNYSVAWQWLRLWTVGKSRAWQKLRWVREPTIFRQMRVPVKRYEENLNAILDGAAQRGIGAVIFQVTTLYSIDEDDLGSHHKKVQQKLSTEREVLLIDAQDLLDRSKEAPSELFIDPVHASGKANAIYAKGIVDRLVGKDWPKNRLVPQVGNSNFHSDSIKPDP
jgi:hypothetical protein